VSRDRKTNEVNKADQTAAEHRQICDDAVAVLRQHGGRMTAFELSVQLAIGTGRLGRICGRFYKTLIVEKAKHDVTMVRLAAGLEVPL
jgi:Na+(H+)/acetate symporter ActP